MLKTLDAKYGNVTNEIPGLGKGLRKVGEAMWLPKEYCVLKLNLFPTTKFFLRAHPVRLYEYVLYSKCQNDELSQPIGRGEVLQGTGYIRVDFSDLKMTFFLQLIRSEKLELMAA